MRPCPCLTAARPIAGPPLPDEAYLPGARINSPDLEGASIMRVMREGALTWCARAPPRPS
jgi:hypothetical protein